MHVDNKYLEVGLLTLTVLTLYYCTSKLYMANNNVLQNGGGIAVREDVVIQSLAFSACVGKKSAKVKIFQMS